MIPRLPRPILYTFLVFFSSTHSLALQSPVTPTSKTFSSRSALYSYNGNNRSGYDRMQDFFTPLKFFGKEPDYAEYTNPAASYPSRDDLRDASASSRGNRYSRSRRVNSPRGRTRTRTRTRSRGPTRVGRSGNRFPRTFNELFDFNGSNRRNSQMVPSRPAPQRRNVGRGGSLQRYNNNNPLENRRPRSSSVMDTQEMFNYVDTITVQGGVLKSCSLGMGVERVNVLMKTEGGPLNANLELWGGPNSAPQRMQVYLEDGAINPFRAIIETPGNTNTIAIRNTASVEFPLIAGFEADTSVARFDEGIFGKLFQRDEYTMVQGESVYTVPFPDYVQSIMVSLRSDGRPVDAKIELLQGPYNTKQGLHVYSEAGTDRPISVIIDSPGPGCVVQITNTAPGEFPVGVSMEPYILRQNTGSMNFIGAMAPMTSRIGNGIR